MDDAPPPEGEEVAEYKFDTAAAYWVCAYANNQHDLASVNAPTLEETSFYKALKLATVCAPGMANYVMYNGTRGVYTHTVEYERDAECVVCGSGRKLEVPKESSLQQVMDALVSAFPEEISAPSLSHARGHLYLRGVLETQYEKNARENAKALCGLGEGEDMVMISVNDKKMKHTMRVRVVFR